MLLHLTLRQLGKRRSTLDAIPLPIPDSVATVRELLVCVVHESVAAYNARVRQGENDLQPMTEETLSGMERVGKLAFGVNYGGRAADEAAAIDTALQGFEDGLYRVFLGQTELTALDSPIALHEGDELTFIRLTMLTGGFF